MAYDFKPFEKRIVEITEHLTKELSSVRTGRATPTVLDGIQIESYGTRVNLNQVATISIEDSRTIRIAPYDVSQAKDIEKAITVANLGLSVGGDEKGVRVFFPELTGERRIELVKIAKEKVEAARTELRHERDEVWSDIQKKERDSEITEDDKFKFKEDMQKRVDAGNAQFEDVLVRKEKEITG